MPTAFTHPVVALGAIPWFGSLARRPAIFVTGAILTILPDLDVIGFFCGIPYGHVLGHRGLSHSLPFAIAVSGVAAIAAARPSRSRFISLWLYFGICPASHGLLDACTNGGLGVAFFAPFSHERYFFPVRPIDVSLIGSRRGPQARDGLSADSPVGLDAFLSARGGDVLVSELVWVWSPSAVLSAVAVWVRIRRR